MASSRRNGLQAALLSCWTGRCNRSTLRHRRVGLARHYRIGVTARGYDDPTVVSRIEAFDGIGLRPYP